MKRMNAAEILGLHKRAEALQHPMHELWDELADFIQPAKAGFVGPKTDGEERTDRLYDSTAPQANDDLAHYLAAGLTPAASPWLQNEFRQKELAETDAYQEWLDECTEIQRSEFIRSNYYEVMGEAYADLPCFGLAAVQAEGRQTLLNQFDGLHFEAIWLKEITALANQYGDLDTTFRCYEQSALQWAQMFGDDVGTKVKELAGSKPEAKLKFIHAVFPRDKGDIDEAGVQRGTADPKRMPYASVWVNLEEKIIVRESGYLELPRYLVRWAKTSGSIWASSPGILALPDIRTLNEAARLELRAWERSIDRPMKSTVNNLVDKLDLGAGGLTIVRDISNLMPLYDATDFNLTAVKTDELRASILRTFFSDLIREPGQTGTQTAYEVARRMERAQRILGEAVGHIRGLLRWSAERSFKLLWRGGRFPAVPEGLLEANPKLDVRYTSPLQAAQESQGMEQVGLWLGDMAQVAAVKPEVLDWVDFDGWAKEAAKRRSVPAVMLNSKDAVAKIRADRTEEQARVKAQQDALTTGQVAKDLGAGLGPEQALRVVQGG